MFSCEQCGKAFGRVGNLLRHRRTVHAVVYRRSSDNTTTDQPTASSAPSNATAEKRLPFYEIVGDDEIFYGHEVLECDVCEMYFLTQEELDKHEKVYTNLFMIT